MVAAGYNPQSCLEVLENWSSGGKARGRSMADAPRDLAKELAEWSRPAAGKGDPGAQAALAELQKQLNRRDQPILPGAPPESLAALS